MLTTASWSGNSNRCGTRASRSFGPISGSVLMIVNTLSITSRNSAATGTRPSRRVYTPRRGRYAPTPAASLIFCDRLALGFADALAGHPQEALPVCLGDPLGQLDDEPPVFLDLFRRALLLHSATASRIFFECVPAPAPREW